MLISAYVRFAFAYSVPGVVNVELEKKKLVELFCAQFFRCVLNDLQCLDMTLPVMVMYYKESRKHNIVSPRYSFPKIH